MKTHHAANIAELQALPPTVAMPAAVRYATIIQAAEHRPVFTPAAFRDLKFKAHDRKNSRGETIKGNGTGPAGVWIQIGSKVLINLDAFDRWVESHKMGGQ
ncbi:MAG: hypothetical protein Q8M20_14340 [Rhodocyclaceae bacterium]|nr:hypothetical protein [Rhodocyclaceae bacterium]MDZ4216180.1 hypothetical protein [Rhodocyclaceae bacterium]